MNAGDGRLTVARQRVARLEAELAAARAELQALEDGTEPGHRRAGGGRQPQPGVTAASSTEKKIALYRSRFVGRTDAYAIRWTSRKTGQSGWSPAVRGGFFTDRSTDADLLPLDDDVIERHLRGDGAREFHAGLYPMLPGDRCRVLACDFDDGDWQEDARAYVGACRAAGVDTLAEISRSGAGAHIWIFFATPVPAAAARAMGAHLLRSAMSLRPSMTMNSYDRFFPRPGHPAATLTGQVPPGQPHRAPFAGGLPAPAHDGVRRPADLAAV